LSYIEWDAGGRVRRGWFWSRSSGRWKIGCSMFETDLSPACAALPGTTRPFPLTVAIGRIWDVGGRG